MSEPSNRSGRVASVDLFRAVAIVAVVLIHVWGPSTEVTPERTPLHAAVFSLFVTGSVWAVPGFFFLSGLMLSQKPPPETWPEQRRWWRRRLSRLLPPYFFWSVLTLIAAGQRDPAEAAVKLLTGESSCQMYFVIALLQAYLLWAVGMAWLRRRPERLQTAVLVGLFAFSVAVHILRAWYLQANSADFLGFSRTTVFPWIGYFALGCLVALSRDTRDRGPASGVLSPPFCALAAFALLALMVTYDVSYRGPHQDPPQNTLLKPAYAIVMICLAGQLAVRCEPRMGDRARRLAAALARDSYGIYLSHVLVMGALSRAVYIQLPGLSLPLELAYRVMALVIVFGLAWAAVRLLSLVPGVRHVSGAEVGPGRDTGTHQ